MIPTLGPQVYKCDLVWAIWRDGMQFCIGRPSKISCLRLQCVLAIRRATGG